MAILRDFEVQMVVDGVTANEYEDDDETTPAPYTITKYVEAISGARFGVQFALNPNYEFTLEDCVTIRVRVDGAEVDGTKSISRDAFDRSGGRYPCHTTMEGTTALEPTGLMRYMFHFADLETRDVEEQDDVYAFESKYGGLGTVRVDIFRAKYRYTEPIKPYGGKNLEAVPEKALKGRPLDVATKMQPIAISESRSLEKIRIKYLDSKPLATFVFKYRTRRALQSLFIISRPSSPTTPLDERSIDELSREEMAKLLKKYKDRPAVKRESAGGSGVRKRERIDVDLDNMRPMKTSKGASGQTIYHLDSDDDEEEEQQEEEQDIWQQAQTIDDREVIEL